jgi:hypothetical protein
MFVAIHHRLSDGSLARVFNCAVSLDLSAQDVANWAFEAFNAPEECLSGEGLWACQQYRANRLRSLSVGDVVQVGAEEFFRCDPFGWTRLECLGSFDSSMDEDEQEDYISDADADGDALASAGWGTDEDYGYYGGEDY